MRIPPGIARIPLWKRDIPKYPLYYKGDPQHKIVLPLFWMKIVPPDQKMPPNYVHFQVHPQMSKLDIQQYLEKIYNVPVLSVRTQIVKRYIEANITKAGGGLMEAKHNVWSEEDKYAYVQLRDDTFQYPTFFEDGGKAGRKDAVDKDLQDYYAAERKNKQPCPTQGLPLWFR